MTLLHPGDAFPHLDLHQVDEDKLDIPESLSGSFGVVLFNRGAWCPFCTSQLKAFQRALPALDELGVRVVSLSVDDEQTTRELVENNKLTFPVGHSGDAHQLAELTGAFVNADPVYVQATGFVLDPEGKVLVSTYSSGAIGRLVAEDVVGMVKYVKSQA